MISNVVHLSKAFDTHLVRLGKLCGFEDIPKRLVILEIRWQRSSAIPLLSSSPTLKFSFKSGGNLRRVNVNTC